MDNSDEMTLLVANIKESPVVNATVFTDRAEVSRLVKTTPSKGAGSYTLQLKGLVEAADPDSIRVKAESSKCEILEVSFGVHHESAVQEESGPVAEAKAHLKKQKAQLEEKRLELDRILQRDKLVQGFVNRELTSKKDETKEEPSAASLVSSVRELLTFHEEHSNSTDKKLVLIRNELEICEEEERKAKDALQKIKRDTEESTVLTSRDVSIIFNAPSDNEVVLRLTYNVSKAKWTPSYDVRVSEANGTPAMQLSYFGVVKQNTGEDWIGAQLALSTATPSVGGTPPAPPTRVVSIQSAYARAMKKSKRNSAPRFEVQRNDVHSRANMNMMQSRMVPVRQTSLNAAELDLSDDSDLDDDDNGIGATAAVASQSAGGSSTFRIERNTTILSDNKDHKVCIAVIELAPQFRYFATPALEAKAYLQVRANNNSAYSLLASNKVSVFFDGSYVCNTSLKQIQPGESFSVFLGTDVSVKVEHKLVKKSSNEGTAATFMVCRYKKKFYIPHLIVNLSVIYRIGKES
jgi:uncharacterized protein (TIGR02231 family)